MTVRDLIGDIAISSVVGIADGKHYLDAETIDYDNFDIIDESWNIYEKNFQRLEDQSILDKEVQSIYYSKIENGDFFDGILVLYRH